MQAKNSIDRARYCELYIGPNSALHKVFSELPNEKILLVASSIDVHIIAFIRSVEGGIRIAINGTLESINFLCDYLRTPLLKEGDMTDNTAKIEREYEEVTIQDLMAGGKFYLIMSDKSDGWITAEKIILPGKTAPTQSNLILKHCRVEEQLSFYYVPSKDDQKPTVVRTGRRVKKIYKMA